MNTQQNATTENQLQLQLNTLEIYQSSGVYLHAKRLFHAYYNEIPNVLEIEKLETEKVKEWIEKNKASDILLQHKKEEYCHHSKSNKIEDHFIFLKEGILINLYYDTVYILYRSANEKRAEDLKISCLKFVVKPRNKKEISFIVQNQSGNLTTKEVEIKKPRIDFETNYNDEFKTVHTNILKNMRKRGTKGLYLFHGQPGTGKSTYIKYLIHCQKKKVIFVSPRLAANLDDINLTNFLLNNPDCILVIEDAEEIIFSRDNHQNTRLSFLLNLTDGLISESLGIQVIATFNTELKNIDKALLRKGRLTTLYEFKPLTVEKTNHLLKKLGHNFHTDKEMSIADIYNYQEENHVIPTLRKVIGFGN